MVLPAPPGYPDWMADIFDVIADPTRREVLAVLLERYTAADSDSGDISVGEIVERLGLSQPTVSKHLKVLRDHGLVHVREERQLRYYSLDAGPLEEVEDWLIPFLSADFDDSGFDAQGDDARSLTVFSAWSGSDLGATVGRAAADSSHRVRALLQDASRRVPWRKRS